MSTDMLRCRWHNLYALSIRFPHTLYKFTSFDSNLTEMQVVVPSHGRLKVKASLIEVRVREHQGMKEEEEAGTGSR